MLEQGISFFFLFIYSFVYYRATKEVKVDFVKYMEQHYSPLLRVVKEDIKSSEHDENHTRCKTVKEQDFDKVLAMFSTPKRR